jgi:hypothetical protein
MIFRPLEAPSQRNSPLSSARFMAAPISPDVAATRNVSPDTRVGLSSERPLARLVKSSADLEETGVRLIAPARPTATLGPATQLFIADHRQYRSQPLVVGDGALIDLPNLVEGAVSHDTFVTDRKPAVGMVDDGDALADRCLGLLARFQDEHHFVVLEGERLREGALLLPGKRILQIIVGPQRPMQVLLIRRRG